MNLPLTMKNKRMNSIVRILIGVSVLLFTVIPPRIHAQDGPTTSVTGFVDLYYAYSFSRHQHRDRSFTTQPLRHNEFNLNLAMIDVRHQAERFRGRFAFQTGTYVQSNLAVEPPLLKNVLEASAGARFGDDVWVDLGIFPSHIGLEGIVSKDNWTYSRSLLADYSPYYETGLSVTAAVSEKVTLRGLLINGWQNISETNDEKAVGTQLQYKPSGPVLLNWSTFVGNEQPDSVASRLRIFNDFYAVVTMSQNVSLAIVFDIGMQKQASGDSYDVWHGAALMSRYSINEHWALAGRVEYFLDRNGVIIPTGTPNNFQTIAASLNIDFSSAPSLLWRIEGRVFSSKDEVYPTRTGTSTTDGFVAISAALTL
jgi:hypothetical protein